ncbi:MAG: acyl-CoA dehydrogenase [Chloroflexi bacterium]|nr:acyl-CoA dehydrogenase family protein [Ardenticatenaceae bacterium]MBL1127420.1 acyl-CoA dehydrogenase [Chloroflexota bacterium]NOG33483.1 acyl-CoA dehydrogenase [Chloroflexota bacterium]
MQKTLDTMRRFVDEELIPLEADFLGKEFTTLEPVLAEKRQQVKKLGLWLPQIPKEYGGLGLTLFEHGLVSRELGRTPIGHYTFNCQAPDAGNMEILIEHGTAEQKERFLMPLLRGEIRSCFSMTEPEFAGSNPVMMGTTAVREGDSYIIDGHKWFTSSADGAAFAVVMAITNPHAENKHLRASQIIVPLDTPGFELVRNISIMGEAGSGWASHAEVRYHEVRVPLGNLLGAEGAGFAIAQERLGPGRIHHCMRWLGIAERAFDLMCTYSLRRQIAPGKTLADQGTIQGWIAESRAALNAATLMVMDTALKIDKHGQYAARDDISLIKFHVAGVLQQVLDRALQVHGGLGMTDDTPIAWWYRHERAARIYDGPDEVHKWSAARRILQRYL